MYILYTYISVCILYLELPGNVDNMGHVNQHVSVKLILATLMAELKLTMLGRSLRRNISCSSSKAICHGSDARSKVLMQEV